MVVLLLGNNSLQNGAPSISSVRANKKGNYRGRSDSGIIGGSGSSSALSSSSSSNGGTVDHCPGLEPQFQPSQQQQHFYRNNHQHHMNGWSSTAATSGAVLDVAPMNPNEVILSSTPTRTPHQTTTTPTSAEDDDSTTTITSVLTDNATASSNYTFSLFQPGDFSDVNPHGIPDRYMRMHKNNVEKARKALAYSLQFRKENQVDTILARPHPKFDQCKAVLPLYLLGRTPDQKHVIFLQRPGLVQLALAQQLNVTIDDLLVHYVFLFEYIWNILEGTTNTPTSSHNATMVCLVDMTGLDVSLLRRPKLLKLVQRVVTMLDSHYPQRAVISLVINVPQWFGTLYRIFSPLLRESSRAKIRILSNGPEQDDMLVKYLGQDVVHHVLPQELRNQQGHAKKRKRHHQPQPQQEKQRHRYHGWGKKHHPPEPTTDVHKELELFHDVATEEGEEPAPVPVAAFHGQSSPMEVELRNFVLERLKVAGQEMMPVV